MATEFEDKYLDVLQNIEFALVNVYQAHADMTDFEAQKAVDGLIRTYQAEAREHEAPLRLGPVAQEAYEAVKAMCDWRLGRSQPFMTDKKQRLALEGQPKTLDEILACLKRIRRSIETWNRRGGRRGYFNFVSEFVK